MFYLLQLLSILFAAAVAQHDAPAVQQFENFGVDTKRLSIFHSANLQLKAFFVIVASLVGSPDAWDMIFNGIGSGLWIYLLFDILLNVFRSTAARPFPWYYLGSNDKDGRRWMRLLGKNAGKKKAAILLSAIILLNLFKLLFL